MMMNWMILRSKRHSLQKAIGKIFSTDQSAKLVHNTNFFLNLNTHCKCRNASINSSYAHPPTPRETRGMCTPCQAWGGGGSGICQPWGHPSAFIIPVVLTQNPNTANQGLDWQHKQIGRLAHQTGCSGN